jgi:phosphate uptake regulator
MLEFDHLMFVDSCKALRESDSTELPYDFKEADRRINKFEREVRRNVVTHLSVSRPLDFVPCLILVTIVIDVERIGDYTKNIADLACQRAERLRLGRFEGRVRKIEEELARQFPTVIELLKQHDEETASAILAEEPWVAKHSEGIIGDIIAGSETHRGDCDDIRLALYVRYLKRINAHLTNIASSVVNPFPRIGFRQKRRKRNT